MGNLKSAENVSGIDSTEAARAYSDDSTTL
jgi:hypothetical protein